MIGEIITLGFGALIVWSNIENSSLRKLLGDVVGLLKENIEVTTKLLNK